MIGRRSISRSKSAEVMPPPSPPPPTDPALLLPLRTQHLITSVMLSWLRRRPFGAVASRCWRYAALLVILDPRFCSLPRTRLSRGSSTCSFDYAMCVQSAVLGAYSCACSVSSRSNSSVRTPFTLSEEGAPMARYDMAPPPPPVACCGVHGQFIFAHGLQLSVLLGHH